jgi:glycosyltransferase involved in cell wall biosynthesis
VSDLLVLGQDPGFGGGALALMEAFLAAARALGRDPELVYVPHPRFHTGARAIDRVEALRLVRGSRRLAPRLHDPAPLWVVAALAPHGYAAVRSGRPYACWLATSLADENRGRLRGLPPSRRLAAHVNAPLLARLERAVLRGATRVFGISPAARSSLAAAGGLPEEQVGVLPLPVDVERFTPEPEERWLARLARPVLAFVGRGDDPRKNVGLALETFELVRRRIPTATLRLIGPRPPQALPEGVEALGQLGSIAEPLRECSLLLLPSRQEGFGLVAAEALAAGVPVVSTPSGGPEELLARSGAGTVTSGWASQELGDATVALLGDPSELLERRRRGIEFVHREHAPSVLTDRLRQVLDA